MAHFAFGPTLSGYTVAGGDPATPPSSPARADLLPSLITQDKTVSPGGISLYFAAYDPATHQAPDFTRVYFVPIADMAPPTADNPAGGPAANLTPDSLFASAYAFTHAETPIPPEGVNGYLVAHPNLDPGTYNGLVLCHYAD